jgi:aminomethyltransferase
MLSGRLEFAGVDDAVSGSRDDVEALRRTLLYERHVALGARMVPFAGWGMPVQYAGVIAEHVAVRTGWGVFDVSHMGQLHVEGPSARDLLQQALSNDLDRVGDGQAQYTLLTNERGGIVDDLIAYRIAPAQYLLVVNAGNREAAFSWLSERDPRGCTVRDASDEYALLAVQGPESIAKLGLGDAPPFTHAMSEIGDVEVMACRTGYTGERGVELMCSVDDAGALWDWILGRGATPCGLGARDTLRLEVCYPLHGNDITVDTDAISAGLGWTCALDKEFTGVAALRAVKATGPERKLVAFVMEEKAVPLHGMPIEGGGEVTSGTHSPMLDVGIGMGYVPAAQADSGSELVVDVRGRPRRARVVRKPIYTREEH